MIRPKRYLMKLAERELQFGDRTLIMGIINVTPDSFSDGGKYMDPERAAERALELEAEGADIIDIGAESTRPGSERVSEAEELRRLIPVLKKLKDRLSVPVSVDTTKAAVAAKAGSAKAKAKAKAKGQGGSKGLGCSKCRFLPNGCARCRQWQQC